jgi:CubicO group peptidase (beta-lactamase class C family)
MIEPTVLGDGTVIPYGYALGVGNGAVGHGGSVVGFRSWMVNYPQEDLTIVLLSNTDIPPSYALDTLAEVIADRILEGAGQ